MAEFKKHKKVKLKVIPPSKEIRTSGNPNQYYLENPAWSFSASDMKEWTFLQDHIGDLFWEEILPQLKEWEKQNWSDILINNKEENHSIDVRDLNDGAKKRLRERYIEEESLVSLRFTGKHRLYGYMTGRVFNILWFDDDHGDNDTCVCRSRKKHT